MSEQYTRDTVGIDALRRHIRRYLDRVAAGETFTITRRGRPVAVLTPVPEAAGSVVDRLVAEGRITPAAGDHRTLPSPPRIPGRPLNEILAEMRDEERLL